MAGTARSSPSAWPTVEASAEPEALPPSGLFIGVIWVSMLMSKPSPSSSTCSSVLVAFAGVASPLSSFSSASSSSESLAFSSSSPSASAGSLAFCDAAVFLSVELAFPRPLPLPLLLPFLPLCAVVVFSSPPSHFKASCCLRVTCGGVERGQGTRDNKVNVLNVQVPVLEREMRTIRFFL